MAYGAKSALNSGVLYEDRRNLYLNPHITKELYPSVTPFTTLIQNMSMVKTPDPDYKMFEHEASWVDMRFLQAGSGNTDALAVSTESADITIDGVVGQPYLGLKVDIYADSAGSPGTYKGQAVITTMTSSSVVQVTPIYKLADPSFADNDIFVAVGHAAGEGTGAPEATSDELTIAWNSAEIMKTPVEITGTLHEMALRGYSSELARLRDDKEKQHKILKEKSFLLGRRLGADYTASTAHINGADGKKIRTTHGVVPFIYDESPSANKIAVTMSTYTYDSFIDDMQIQFLYSNDNAIKYAVTGDTALGYWSKIESSGFLGNAGVTINISPEEERFGFNVRNLRTPSGLLRLTRSPLMSQGMQGVYSGYMVIVDPENVQHVTYRASRYETNIQANDLDGQKDQYFSDEGLGITLPKTHGYFIMS